MIYKRSVAKLLAVAILPGLFGCGTSTSPSTTPGTDTSPFQDAQSATCSSVRGIEALYWDLGNGAIRTDYPETLRLLPYSPGQSFIHTVQPLYNFVYPSDWRAEMLTDPSLQLTGANVTRQDNGARWRRLNLTLPRAVTATEVLDIEVQQMLTFLGNPGAAETVCFLESPDRTAASLLIRAGNFTANINAQVFVSPFLDGFTTVVFVQLVVAPTADYTVTAVNVFFPLTGQMNLGGGGDSECSDGIDNDGDGQTDYPDDSGCSSAEDDSEAG